MSNPRRDEIFAQAAKKLRSEFEELSVVPHNALKGHEAEDIIRKFLESHIPKRFSVGAGFILDPLGNISPQTDVIIYDAFNCPVYRASDEASIFPSNNVSVVIEVKSSLDKKELEDAWEKIAAIKGLTKTSPAEGPLLAQTAGVLFAFDSKLTLTKLSEHYRNQFVTKGIGRHIDYVVVLDKGIITLAAKLPGVDGWSPIILEGLGGSQAEGTHLAVSVSQFDEYTLDGFFRLLLTHLTLFRGIVDHPGFQFGEMPIKKKQQMLSYLTSITVEADPEIRDLKLKKYKKHVEEEFGKSPMPADWEKET